MHARLLPLAVLAGAGLLGACREATGVDAATANAAGVYVLQPASESAPYGQPKSGSMLLSRSGRAERKVTYPDDANRTYVAKGTFRVTGETIELRLFEQNTGYGYPWSPVATLRGSTLTLGYPGPADGWITETYHRLSTLVP